MVGTKFDLGQLAETLLFYQNNLILLDRSSLLGLIDAIGLDAILRLVDEFGVKLSYHREAFATLTNNNNGIKIHNFTDVKFGGRSGQKIKSTHEEIEYVINQKFGSTKTARKFAFEIIERTASKTLKQQENIDLINSARNDLLDHTYAEHAARIAISQLAPTAKIPGNLIFRAIDFGADGFMLHSNIDFAATDLEYRRVPGQEGGSISDELLANYIFSARVDAYFASTYMSSYICDNISSELIKRKFFDLIRKTNRDINEIDLFQEHIYPAGMKLREAINAGEITFDEALAVISQAKKFQKWLKGLNPDRKLLSEYLAEVSKENWLGKLPGKAFRWVTMGGLGIVVSALLSPAEGTLTSLGLGALDTFLLDKIFKGWRPDQFVLGPLGNILDTK